MGNNFKNYNNTTSHINFPSIFSFSQESMTTLYFYKYLDTSIFFKTKLMWCHRSAMEVLKELIRCCRFFLLLFGCKVVKCKYKHFFIFSLFSFSLRLILTKCMYCFVYEIHWPSMGFMNSIHCLFSTFKQESRAAKYSLGCRTTTN